MKKLMVIALATALAGCESLPRFQDGYQLGDISRTAVDGTVEILTIQAEYCATSDPIARKLLLKLIRAADNSIPDEGLCTDLLGGDHAVSE